jgi:hypothetical protein
MESNELNSNDKKLIDKANFYKSYEKIVHVLTIPKGTFKNGMIVSELKEGKYFWFIENGMGGIPQRLFLSEIYDIEEYNERNKGERV